MSKLFNELKEKVQGKNKKIVFPEGEDIRILEAVVRLAKEGLVVPILIGEAEKLQAKAKSLGLSLDGIQILHHSTDKNFSEKVAEFVACRKGKATEEQAQELLKDENYYGTMLVHMKEADGLVSGAIHSTGDTVRPALQIIKTKPGVSKVAGVFVMEKGDTRYIFGDCAITIHPNAEDLAGIAVAMVGQIAFVGLMVPHIVRYLVGTDYARVIPLTAVVGGLLLLVADTVARMLGEAPVGAIISFIGVPYFLYLVKRGGRFS